MSGIDLIIPILVALVVAAVVVWLVRRPRPQETRGAPARVEPPPGTARADFDDLVESAVLRRGLKAVGWAAPRPVQSQTVDGLRSGRDLIVTAPEGSGKTGAYIIPALDRQVDREGLHTLVIAPTREMVREIAAQATALARDADLWVGEIHDGTPAADQVRDLRAGFDVLVATPDRLLQHLDDGNVSLDEVELLVLDPIDTLLQREKHAEVRRILAITPSERQVVFVGRSLSGEAMEVARTDLRDPLRINVEAATEAGPRPPDDLTGQDRVGAGGAEAADEITGTVLWFSNTKGFGFIEPDDGGEHVFVHHSNIAGDGFATLEGGQRVRFRRFPTEKSPEAREVRPL